jgi:hypothetical protein
MYKEHLIVKRNRSQPFQKHLMGKSNFCVPLYTFLEHETYASRHISCLFLEGALASKLEGALAGG